MSINERRRRINELLDRIERGILENATVVTITDDMVERAARSLADLQPGEPWPSNADLTGNLTGTRDDEYREGLLEEARAALVAALTPQPSGLEHPSVSEVAAMPSQPEPPRTFEDRLRDLQELGYPEPGDPS